MAIITGQVIRGKRSHFNHATPFDETLFNAMAVTVVILWTSTLVIAILLMRARIADRASAWAIRSGVLLALVGAGFGFLMTQPTPEQRAAGNLDTADVIGAHSVGVPDGGPSMPLTGWSTTGGDLRIPHFIGMHALQLLPLFLLALVSLAPRFPGCATHESGCGWCWWPRGRTRRSSRCSPGRRCAASRWCTRTVRRWVPPR